MESLSCEEFCLLREIIRVLDPVKATVEALCRSDMDLCKADTALAFMLSEISAMNCKLSNELKVALRFRINERSTINSTLLNFLKNPNLKAGMDNDVDLGNIRSQLCKPLSRIVNGVYHLHLTLPTKLDLGYPMNHWMS